MHEVAEHLAKHARKQRRNPQDVDRYARSAFNRYYYATFLIARSLVKLRDPNWRGSHSGLPGELKGKLSRQVKSIRDKANRLQDYSLVNDCEVCIHNMNKLSALLSSAYDVRVTADYLPETIAEISSRGVITLGSTSIEDAKHWPSRASQLTTKIESFWRLTSVI